MTRLSVLHGACQPSDRVACDGAGPKSLADLLGLAAAVAEALPLAPVGTHVAVMCADRYHFAAALLGVWRRGLVAALPPNGQSATVANILNLPDVIAILHDAGAATGINVADLAPVAPGGDDLASYQFAADQPLVLVFTSGSSGFAAAHPKTAGQLLGEAASHDEAGWVTSGDVVIATVPPHHLYGLLFSVLLPLRVRATFHRHTPLHAPTIAAFAAAARVVLVSVPAHLAALQTLAAEELRSVVRVICSTAPLPETTATALQQRGLRVTEVFGSSETGGIASRQRPSDTQWQALPGVALSVAPTDSDGSGLLSVDSPFLPPGAIRPMPTGDRVRLASAAAFAHLGRVDDIVKIAGIRVSVVEMQQRLASLPGVADAAVVAVDAPGVRGRALIAAVVAPTLTVARLREALTAWFVPSVVPRRIALVAQLPRDGNGKLTRRGFDTVFATPQPLTMTAVAAPAANQFWFRLSLPLDHSVFDGHFPGYPVLAGVAQLGLLVLPALQTVRGDWTPLQRVTRLKFRRIIRPGDTLQLELVVDDGSRSVDFVILRDAGACASGRLHF